MRCRFTGRLVVLIAAMSFSPVLLAQSNEQSEPAKDSAVAPSLSHDLSRMWMEYPGSGAIDEKSRPPLTPWGQARFDTTYPQLGPGAVPVQVFTKQGKFVKEFFTANRTLDCGSAGSIDFSSDSQQK